LTGRIIRAGPVNRNNPGYAPANEHGTYATSKSGGTCLKVHAKLASESFLAKIKTVEKANWKTQVFFPLEPLFSGRQKFLS
jgi:hypothetical protein